MTADHAHPYRCFGSGDGVIVLLVLPLVELSFNDKTPERLPIRELAGVDEAIR